MASITLTDELAVCSRETIGEITKWMSKKITHVFLLHKLKK